MVSDNMAKGIIVAFVAGSALIISTLGFSNLRKAHENEILKEHVGDKTEITVDTNQTITKTCTAIICIQ